MRLFRRRGDREEGGGLAVAEPSLDEIQAEIDELTEANRTRPDLGTERRLLRARHLAGIALMDGAGEDPQFAEPFASAGREAPFEARREDVTPGVLRASILRHGCLLVRGLVPRAAALDFAGGIARAYDERSLGDAGQPWDHGYYEEFEPEPRFGNVLWRAWIKEGGGLLAADSPHLNFEMMEMFAGAGVRALVSGYLGEPALMSVHKSTLRKADPDVAGAWHQDGFFMGPVRSLNLWLALSRCGEEAPGLDILPRRLEHYLATGTEGAELTWTISDREVEEVAAGTDVIRPIFEPGDALFFDELFLHKTGSDPAMPKPRFAIENWFFGGSRFPGEYAPLAV